MSKALDYLAKTRPEAATHYLNFLKECGQHLDPKTRFLISVVTKVACGTDRGLRQYIPQALDAGATPNEVLDAILSSFPAAGLTNVLKAIDVLLDMDLPDFRPESLAGKPEWHEVTLQDKVPEGKPVRLEAGGRSLFVCRDAADVRVYDSHCSHQGTNIPELALKDGRLVCPKHGWVFDVSTGRCIKKGDRPLKSYEVKIDGNVVLAYW